MSISRNQIEALRKGYIQKIGSGNYSIVNTKDLPILEKVLAEYGLDFNNAIVANLEKSGSISKGKLAEPSMPVVTKFGNQYVLNLGYPVGSEQIKYYDYINEGVKGYKSGQPSNSPYSFKNAFPNRKMAANIFSWLNTARKSSRADNVSTSPTQAKRQRLKKVLSEAENKRKLAYAISSSIKSKGIKQTKYFDNAISQVFDNKFTKDVAYAIISDMSVKIYGKLKKENKG
jgi:hypothetical protein